MINHQHKFLFIHVPRTGGSSIEYQFDYKEGQEQNKHWNLNGWKNYLNSEDFDSYFKFTFVRNPWDILISKYVTSWYSLKGRGSSIGYKSGKTLKYFLDHYEPVAHEHGDGLLDYFDPKQMDFIARFENRNKDLEYISNKIGFNIDANTKRRDHRHKKHYTEYYDDETREIVAEKYARDIEYFGYKFGE